MRILITGHQGLANRGCEALLRSTVAMVRTRCPDARFYVPSLDERADAAQWPQARDQGVAFVPVRFTPTSSKHEKKECGGVHIAVTDWKSFEPVLTGLTLACALRDLFGAEWKHDKLQWLLRDQAAYDAFVAGKDAREIERGWKQELDVFRMRRKPFLVYQ